MAVFPDVPVMQLVAKCESHIDQSAVNETTKDYGTLQINKRWLPLAESFGMDIVNSVDDNLLFGRYLYNKYGLQPWKSSAKCWAIG